MNAETGVLPVSLRSRPRSDAEIVGRVPAFASVRVIAGPSENGWYRIEAGTDRSRARGWTPGSGLTFVDTAVLLWDAGIFSAATDVTGWLASIRHGVVVTVAGPPTDGFTFIQFGDLRGYTYSSALQTSDQPTTDPYGEWWADVNRSLSKVNLMIGTTVVDTFSAAMSSESGDGFYSTAPGTYWVYEKVPGLQYTTYADAYFMYWCGFDSYRYNGFHSWTMDQNGYVLNGGWGNTSGCVSTEPGQALVIYNFLSLNSRVEVHW